MTGIYEHHPGNPVPNVVVPIRESVVVGTTNKTLPQLRHLMELEASNWKGKPLFGFVLFKGSIGRQYHLLRKNCNHFCDYICLKIAGTTVSFNICSLFLMFLHIDPRLGEQTCVAGNKG